MSDLKMGTGTFLRRTGLSAPVMRGLEVAGVIAPSKTDTGWRQFSESDVRRALAWKQARQRKAGKRHSGATAEA